MISIFLLTFAGVAAAQTVPPSQVTLYKLANDNNFFIYYASKTLKWEEPTDPVRIVGPIYFIGTEGLGVFLFATSEGHILMNTGMPSSGPMIVDSIRKLGFKPEDIKILINAHAHIDHAGALAYMKRLTGAPLAVMKDDVAAMESGDRNDFKYGDDLAFEGVKVDRVLRDGDTVKLGDVLLTARHTPGHSRGATTWVANVVADGKAYLVAFPDGAGVNPGYRVAKNPSYPGITDDYRNTLHALEMMKPDIWLAEHNEYYDFAAKRERAATEGVKAWIDPEGYRRFVAGKKRAFEDEVDNELGASDAAK
jgi:metallo-beta-lactamase class B